jgi:hypothetical protein
MKALRATPCLGRSPSNCFIMVNSVSIRAETVAEATRYFCLSGYAVKITLLLSIVFNLAEIDLGRI